MRKILMVFAIGIVATLTACGGSNELEGTWRIIDYYINYSDDMEKIDDRAIIIGVNEITFTATQLSHNGYVTFFEISEDENHLIVSSGWFQGSNRFEIEGDVLVFSGERWFKVDSNEYDEHRQEVESMAYAELDVIIAQIEEQQAKRLAEMEAEELLQTAWNEAVDELLNEYEAAIDGFEERVQNDVLEYLQGVWEGRSEGGWAGDVVVETLTITDNNFVLESNFIDDANRGVESENGTINVSVEIVNGIDRNYLQNLPNHNFDIEQLRPYEIIVSNFTNFNFRTNPSIDIEIRLSNGDNIDVHLMQDNLFELDGVRIAGWREWIEFFRQ